MSEFDPSTYFAKVFADAPELDIGRSLESLDHHVKSETIKGDQLLATKAAKVDRIKQASAQYQAKLLENQKNSWSGRLGLNPEGDKAAFVNAEASLVSGGSRTIGDLVSLPVNINAGALEGQVSEEAVSAYNRQQKGFADLKDLELLAQQPKAKGRVNQIGGTTKSGKTNLELLESAVAARKTADNIDKAFDISKIVDSTKRDEYVSQLKDNADLPLKQLSSAGDSVADGEYLNAFKEGIPAIAKLISTGAVTSADNLGAVGQYITENAPQLAVGFAGKGALLASNIGYAIEPYNQGILKYQAENNGAYPPEDVRTEMAAYALSAGVAEQLMDATLFKQVMPDYLSNKVSKLGNPVTGIAGATAGEAATEGYQTFAEGQAKLEPVSAKDIYVGAVIGGATGGGLVAPGQAVRGVAQAAKALSSFQIGEDNSEQVAAFEAAAETGDVSRYSDPKTKTYSPDTAIQALMKFSQREGTTTTQKEIAAHKAAKVLEEAKATLASQTAQLNAGSSEVLTERKADIARLTQELANPEGFTEEQIKLKQQKLDLTKEAVEAAEQEGNSPEAIKKNKAHAELITKLAKRVDDAQTIFNQFAIDTRGSKENTESSLAIADSTPDASVPEAVETAKKAASHVVTMAMNSPESLSPEQARNLASNTNNVFDADQRKFLTAYAESSEASSELKSLVKVNTTVLKGDGKKKGIATYRNEMHAAIQANDADAARSSLRELVTFRDTHLSKASEILKAFETATQTRKDIFLARSKDGVWAQTSVRPSKKARKAGIGLTIHYNSGELVQATQAEAKLLVATHKELAAAGKVAFKKRAPTEQAVTARPAKVAKAVKEEAPAKPVIEEAPKPVVAPKQVKADKPAVVATPVQGSYVPAKEAGTPKKGQVWVDSKGAKRTLVGKSNTNLIFENESGSRTTTTVARLKKSGWSLVADSTIPGATKEETTLLKEMLEHPRWSEKGGLLLRDLMGAVTGRTTWVATYEALAGVLANTGVSNAKAIELITRAEEGHPPLTERQQAIVDGLLEALNEMKQDPETYQFEDTEEAPATDSQPSEKEVTNLESELQQVGGLVRFLGVENTGVEQGSVPTLQQITDSLEGLLKALSKGSVTKQALASLVSWADTSNEPDAKRMERATYKKTDANGKALSAEQLAANKAKYVQRVAFKAGTPRQYLTMQVAEELIEVLEAYLENGDLAPDAPIFKLLEGQKRILKEYRFGPLTPIKDENSPYNGLNNSEAVEKAIEDFAIAVEFRGTAEIEADVQTLLSAELKQLNSTVYAEAPAQDKVEAQPEPQSVSAVEPVIEQEVVESPDLVDFSTNGIEANLEGVQTPADAETITNEDPTDGQVGELFEAADAGLTYEDENGNTILNESLETATVGKVPGMLGLLQGAKDYVLEIAEEAADKVAAFNEAFRSANLIKLSFVQKDIATPLLRIKNFISQWDANPTLVDQFAPKGVAYTDDQKALLNLFKYKAKQWEGTLRKAFPKDRDPKYYEFRHENYASFFVEGLTPDQIDENLLTALSFAGFSWIQEKSGDPLWNTPENIRAILHLKDDAGIPPAAWAVLGTIGAREPLVIRSLGQRALLASGLALKPNMEESHRARLETALGGLVVNLLVNEGYAERTEVSQVRLDGLIGKTTPAQFALSQNYFIRVAQTTQAITPEAGAVVGKNKTRQVLADQVLRIREDSKGTKGVLDKLFAVQTEKRGTFTKKPVPKGEKRKVQGSSQGAPKELQDALDTVEQQHGYLREDMATILTSFPARLVQIMAGVKHTDDRWVSKGLARAQEAKNEGQIRELAEIQEYMDTLNTTGKNIYKIKLYFQRNIWKQQRVGLGGLINMQAGKVMRHAFSLGGWEVKIPFPGKIVETALTAKQAKDPAYVERAAQLAERKKEAAEVLLQSFKLGVAESLGIKTENMSPEDAIKNMENKLNGLVFEDALAALTKLLIDKQPLELEEQEAITNAVTVGKEKFHTLDGLVAWAQYKAAEKAGESSFTTRLMREVDGKTNGPALTMLQLGTALTTDTLFKEYLNKAGFYQQGDKATSFTEWWTEKDKVQSDLYQSLGKKIVEVLPPKSKLTRAIFHFTGELATDKGEVTTDGRNIAKPVITKMTFGSAGQNIVSDMADDFILSIYEKLEEIANSDEAEEVIRYEMATALDSINELLAESKNKGAWVPTDLSIESAMDFEFSAKQIEAIRTVFANTVGEAVENAMEAQYGILLYRRDMLTQGVNLGYQLYEIAHTVAVRNTTNKLMDEGVLAFRTDPKTGERIPYTDLKPQYLKEIDESLKDLVPRMHTAMSAPEKDTKLGLLLSKIERKLTDNPVYQSKLSFGNTIATKGEKNNSVKSMTVSALERALEAPGVGSLVLAIHSTDSAIASRAYRELEALNVHDALGLSVAELIEGAKLLNQNTFEAMLNYSAPAEMYAGVAASMKAFFEQAKGLGVKNSDLKPLADNLDRLRKSIEARFEVKVQGGILTYILNEFKAAVDQADISRLSALSVMAIVDQYPSTSGAYSVTDKNREDAIAMKGALTLGVDPALAASVVTLENMLAKVNEVNQGKKRYNSAGELVDLPAEDAAGNNSKTYTRTKTGSTSVKQGPLIGVLTELNKALAYLESLGDVDSHVDFVKALKLLKSHMDRPVPTGKNLAEVFAAAKIPASMQAHIVQYLSKGWTPARSVWGQLGKPLVEPNIALVKGFESNPPTKGSDLIQRLITSMKAQAAKKPSPQIGFSLVLLAGLEKAMGTKDVDVVYITKDTPMDGAVGTRVSTANGFYTVVDGKGTIYIKSPDFVHSNLSSEVLLHELTHSVLQALITREMEAIAANPKYVSPIAVQLKELTSLLNMAKGRIHGNAELTAKYSNALTNIHELISWGMTNSGFQKDVLGKIEIASATAKEPVPGLRAFFKTIVDILFPGKGNPKLVNGMALLTANVSVLFEEASKAPNEHSTGVQTFNQDSPESRVNKFTLENIYDALKDSKRPLADKFDAHLRSLMAGIVAKLHGPYGSNHLQAQQGQAFTPEEVWLKSLATGKQPFVAAALQGMLPMSQQEALLVEETEAVIRAAFNHPDGAVSYAYKEIRRIYADASKRLSAKDFHKGDWSTASDRQKEAAENAYSFIFSPVTSEGELSNYLSKFAALGLAYAPLNALLNVPTKKQVAKTDRTWSQRLTDAFNQLLDFLYRFTSKTIGKETDREALDALVDQLVDIEAKRRSRIAAEQSALDAAVTNSGDRLVQALKEKAAKLGQADFFKKSPKSLLRLSGIVLNVVGNQRQEAVMETITKFRDFSVAGKHGILASLLNEANGENDTNLAAHQLLRAAQRNEQLRKELRTQTQQYVINGFEDGEKFSTETKAVISKLMLRSGMANMLDPLTTTDLERLVSNTNGERDREIKKHTQALKAMGANGNYYIKSIKQLAWYRTTGRVRGDNLMQNTANIASMFGTHKAGKVSQVEIDTAVSHLNPLATLFALKYAEKNELNELAEVMRRENARENANGVDLTLRLHKQLQEESKNRLFKGEEALQMFGYTPEIYNPHVDVVAAGMENEAFLVAQGYERQDRKLKLDPSDPSPEILYLYVRKFGGLRPQVTGVMSYTGKSTKGSTVHSGITNVNEVGINEFNQRENRVASAKRASAVRKMFDADDDYDPRTDDKTRMAPVVNPDGQVVNYRYMMQDELKDDILERNNDFDEILGVMAGSIFDKETSAVLNRRAVQALKDQYDADYASNAKSFVRISRDSSDKEFKEIYAKLPKDTQKAINEIWGSDGMMVRVDLLDITFGYRKSSLTTVFEKDVDERTATERVAVMVMSTLVGVRKREEDKARLERGEALIADAVAARRLQLAEEIWQQIVAHTKDIIVVKSGVILMGNITSNIVQLLWHGVPPMDIVRNHRIALKGALAYREDKKQLHRLEKMVASGYIEGSLKDIQQQIVVLKDTMARNPVRELIEAGLMPTIVEDNAAEEDTYSYKSFVADKMDGITSRIPKHLRTLGKQAYMAHDTQLYQIMSQSTQLSDFVARYTLYQHETTKRDAPLSADKAISKVSSAFVNYDIPTHRSVQWMNDMGLFMFTKYYIRIQKVLFMLYREQPARALALLAFEHFYDGVATPMDSALFAHIGNPLHEGAFSYLGAVTDTLPIKVAMSPF